ncbi:helix-turn-helix transcriptional regulator [Streptomyces sp. NPDC001793]|uniref:helix-turn-helix domain-containing protein n=1 Tax=Streptomyces sp. NPDC001793 TaxID=3154657 RepID=UPI003316C4BC
MPPREVPTARQARLGAELRKMRERAGKTALDAAGLLASDRARISHIEAGRSGVSEERIRRLATFYGCDDDGYVDALCAMSREHRGQFWWDEYRGVLPPAFLDMAELEHHAAYIRAYELSVIPGVLQTEDYARAVFQNSILPLSVEDLEVRVEHRMKRKQILERGTPTSYYAIVHEGALRMRYGGRKILRKQLETLAEASDGESTSVRVIPFDVEQMVASAQPLTYAGGPVSQLDSVQVDSYVGGGILDADTQLKAFRNLWEVLESLALNAEESRNLFHRIAREM